MGKARLERILQEKVDAGQNIFAPYIMAGDGGLEKMEERIQFLEASGAAAIELGVPFSDPVADGPTIQEAGIRALNRGVTLSNVLEKLQATKKNRLIPIVIMSYLNPILSYGVGKFAKACKQAGVDGVIIPDLPMEEEQVVSSSLKEHDIAFVRLAAMTSPKERLVELAKHSEGFLYAVAVNGTTGARTEHDLNVTSYLSELKEYSKIPVLAGFGVSTVAQAQELSTHCDGVIVGSKIVDLLHEGDLEAIKSLIDGSVHAEVKN